MLIAAQRVQRAGLSGVNWYYYRHVSDQPWSADPAAMFDAPVQLVDSRIEVPGGGNLILSYADVVAPEDTHSGEILEFIQNTMDWTAGFAGLMSIYREPPFAVRFHAQPQLLPYWKRELKQLLRCILLP